MYQLTQNILGSMRRSFVTYVVAIVIVAVVAGCSGSDSITTGTPHPTASGTPTPLVGGPGSSTVTTAPSSSATSVASPSPTSSAPGSPGAFASNCPPLDEVNSALGLTNNLGPETSPYRQGTQCVYSAAGNIPPPIPQVTVYFEPATAASFTQTENGVVNSGLATAVMGLGDQAFIIPGDINVLKGSTKIEIVSPLSIPNPNGNAALKVLAQFIVASVS